jgi:hypothetical protein
VKFISTTVKTVIGAAGIATAGVFTAATAIAAPPTIHGFGTSEQLVDGALVTAYTVNNLQPSNATVPGYTPQGHLYEANITAQANSGTITPLVSDFNARATNGQQYRVVDTAQLPNGLSPAPITQGNQASGTLYFDVTGAQPNQVRRCARRPAVDEQHLTPTFSRHSAQCRPPRVMVLDARRPHFTHRRVPHGASAVQTASRDAQLEPI